MQNVPTVLTNARPHDITAAKGKSRRALQFIVPILDSVTLFVQVCSPFLSPTCTHAEAIWRNQSVTPPQRALSAGQIASFHLIQTGR